MEVQVRVSPGRHRVLRSTIRGPPAQAVRLSDCPTVCLPLAAGLPARAPRALVLSEWEAGVSIRASKKEIPRATVWDITIHTAGVAIGRIRADKKFKMNNRKPKNVGLVTAGLADTASHTTIPTRYGTSSHSELNVRCCSIHLPYVGSCIFRD